MRSMLTIWKCVGVRAALSSQESKFSLGLKARQNTDKQTLGTTFCNSILHGKTVLTETTTHSTVQTEREGERGRERERERGRETGREEIK